MRRLGALWHRVPRRAKNGSRRQPRRLRTLLFSRRTALMGAVLVLAAGIAAVWQTGIAARVGNNLLDSVIELSARAGLTVQAVWAEGRSETAREDVLAALGVERGMPIAAFDPDAAKARLEDLGWVRSASVQRHWPDAIYLQLVERRPMARWQNQGRVVLVDREGAVIGPASEPRFKTLPLIVGAGAPEAAPPLFDRLAAEPDLFIRVRACVRVGERRWNLEFDNGVEVLLPEGDVSEAWARLAVLVHEQRLFEKAIVAIDLRLPDRLVLRLAPEAAGRLTGAEKRI